MSAPACAETSKLKIICPTHKSPSGSDNVTEGNLQSLTRVLTTLDFLDMGVQKKTRKFATVKRIIGQRDARLKKNQNKAEEESKKKKDDEVIREVYGSPSSSLDLY